MAAMTGNRFQPAILGGLFIGILSSLPLVQALNVCCCLWVVIGGVLTTYLRQQQTPDPLETSEAVLTGLIAGAIGALLSIIATWALFSVTGPIWQDQFRSELEANPDVPPQMRDMMLNLMSPRGMALIQFGVTLPVFAFFSMLGALLGLSFFRKKPLPPPSA
jgi:hypothetical protein